MKLLWVDGWKYVILSFMDVEGNYFTVLAYRWSMYSFESFAETITNILQLMS